MEFAVGLLLGLVIGFVAGKLYVQRRKGKVL